MQQAGFLHCNPDLLIDLLYQKFFGIAEFFSFHVQDIYASGVIRKICKWHIKVLYSGRKNSDICFVNGTAGQVNYLNHQISIYCGKFESGMNPIVVGKYNRNINVKLIAETGNGLIAADR